jgi:hypothetical protein
MDVTIVTSAPTDGEALDLLKLLGFPLAEAREAAPKAVEAAKHQA